MPDPGRAAVIPMQRLRQRADFLAAATGSKVPTAAFVLQTRRRDDDSGPVRVGFTVSKKVGNAVERNRVRRRLREIVKRAAVGCLRPGHDYVLIGRRAALELPFDRMVEQFDGALRRLRPRSPEPGAGSGRGTRRTTRPNDDEPMT